MYHSPSSTSPQSRAAYSDLELYSPPAPPTFPGQLSADHGPEVYQYSDAPQAVHAEKGPVPATAIQGFEDPIRSQRQQRLICGIPRKRFWIITGVVALVFAIAAGVGGGVGSYLSRSGNSSHITVSVPSNGSTTVVANMSIASLHWVDLEGIGQYRVYIQPPNETRIMEASWSATSTQEQWLVSAITADDADIKSGSPLTAVAGYTYANASHPLVRRSQKPAMQ